jgi:hypothetical protein
MECSGSARLSSSTPQLSAARHVAIADGGPSRSFAVVRAGRESRASVATFSVLLVPEPSGVPFFDSVDADELPSVGDLILVHGNLAQVTHVWPGEQAAELRAIGHPGPTR